MAEWSDGAIFHAVATALNSRDSAVQMDMAMRRMRDDYEADVKRLRAEIADHLDTIEKFADQVGAASEELIRLRAENEELQAAFDLAHQMQTDITDTANEQTATIARLRSENERLRKKVDYYESLTRQWLADEKLGEEGYHHLFTEEGICIRCGEDAEEWDSGCVEEIVASAVQGENQLAAAREHIRQLEAGQEWKPVTSGEIQCDGPGYEFALLRVDGVRIALLTESDEYRFLLPDGYCIARRRPQEEQP
jgi:chromosome segregation ATPase